MVKPRLIKEVREWDKTIVKYEKEVIDPQICSQETVDKVKHLLRMLLKVRREQVESCTHPIFQWLEKQELLKKL